MAESSNNINFHYTYTGLDGLQQKINQINTSSGALGSTHGKLNTTLANTAGKFFLLYGLYAVGNKAIQEIQKTLGAAVDSYREFNEAITEVSTTLMQQDMQVFPELQHGVEALSVAFGKSSKDLANGLYEIISAAVPVEDALSLLYTSTKAAVAGLTDVSTAVDVMTSILNAYQLTTEQMVHVSDVLFTAVLYGKFRFEDLASSLGYVVPIAAQVGISLEELSAVMATTTRYGQHIDSVTRGLALAMQNIIKPGQEAIEVAAQYGIELDLATLRAKGLVGYLQELNEKTGGNAAIISKIIPNMRSYRVLMVAAGEGIADVEIDMERMSESLGRADEAFTKMAQTGQRSTDIITQAFEDVNRSIGEAMLPLDLLSKKFDIFKGFFVQRITTGWTAFKPFASLIQGALDAQAAYSRIDKTITKYQSKWASQFEEMIPEMGTENKTLAERLFGGEQVDLGKYQDQADEYLDKREQWAKKVAEVQGLITSGQLTDPSIIFQVTSSLEDEYNQLMDMYDAYAYWKAGIDDVESALDNSIEDISIYTTKLEQLKEEIGSLGNVYDGTLGKQLRIAESDKVLADMNEYLNLGIQDEKYQIELAAKGFDWYNESVAQAISVVRAYEAQQKAATAAQREFNFALAENELKTMRLQLIGMMRRRGLTRQEEKQLKMLEIERTKIRIEEAKKQLEAQKDMLTEETSVKEMAYQEAKEILDSMVRDEQHSLWILKDTRQDDVDSLLAQIGTKELAYMDLSNTVTTELDTMKTNMEIYKNLVVSYYGEDIPLAIQNTIDAYNLEYEAALRAASVAKSGAVTASGAGKISVTNTQTGVTSNPGSIAQVVNAAKITATNPGTAQALHRAGIPGFAEGISRVPHDMIAMIHKDEAVVPAKYNNGNGSTVINNSFGNIVIKDEITLSKFMKMLSMASRTNYLATNTGASNYDVR